MITAAEYKAMRRNGDDEIESFIDTAIRSNAWKLYGSSTIHVDAAGCWSATALARVLLKYQDAGWSAQLVHGRDGDFIRLVLP